MTKRRITTHKIEWRGFLLFVREEADYLWPGQTHITTYVVRPKRAAIPITRAGYRSHFIVADALMRAGGAVAFITAWLDREAGTKAWRYVEIKAQQLSFEL